MEIESGGVKIRVICKSNTKNMRLSVNLKTGVVTLSTPKGIPKRYIKSFADSHVEWIKTQLEKAEQRNLNRFENNFFDGGSVNIFGEYYRVTVIFTDSVKKAHFEISDGAAKVLVPSGETYSEDTGKMAYEEYARQILTDNATRYFEKYRTAADLECAGFAVRRMTSRWGSYSHGTHRISLSFYLVDHPQICLEYVVLHELVHSKISGHGKDFYNTVAKYMPEWKTAETLLKK